MKIKVWVQTNKIGSRVEREIELEEDEDEPLTDSEIHDHIMDEPLWRMLDWGWERVPTSQK